MFKSDSPWRCLIWLVLQQDNLLMLTAVVLWCHQLPFKWRKDSERGPAFGKKPLYTSLQTWQGVRYNRRHPFSDILKKNFANKWSRTAAGKSKTSTMLPLFIDDKYRWFFFFFFFFHFTGSFSFLSWFCLLMYDHFNFFLTNSLVRNLPMWLHFFP